MKVVGLHIDEGRVAATVVQRQFGKTEILDSFEAAFASEAELAEVVRAKSRTWGGARIVASLPGRFCTQRVVTLPFSDRKKIEKALPFEVEDLVPFSLDDAVLDHLTLAGGEGKKNNETTVLCLLVPKQVLRQHLVFLAGLGIDPHVVAPSFTGLAAVSRMMPAETATLFLQGRDACIADKGVAQGMRSLAPAPTGGLRHVLQGFETELKARVEKAVLLAADTRLQADCAEMQLAVEQVAPALGGKQATDAVSLGLALDGETNFRKGEFAYRIADEGARRRTRAIIVAACVAALLFAVNSGVKFVIVRSGYGKLDKEIKDIFRQTFPEARSTGDPLREMRDKLAEAKKQYGALGSGASALDVMKTVTDGIPKEIRVAFQEFTLEGDRLRLQGEAATFEAVDKIKAELQKSPLFADVAVQDTRMGVDNKVKFRMDIKLTQAL